MDDKKIYWCCKKKSGIKLTELKSHLDKSYIEESENDLEEINLVGGKWKVIISYYACYEAVYSLLMKCGVKSEIHDCTIELMSLFGFEENEINFLKDLKKTREENQYYLKRNKLEDEEKVRSFVWRCKEISQELNSEKIEEIRSKIKVANNE